MLKLESPAQPIEIIAYHRPDQYDKDDAVLKRGGNRRPLRSQDAASIYRDLVRDKQLALAAGAESQFPGGKYPGLFFFYLIPGRESPRRRENEKELDDRTREF